MSFVVCLVGIYSLDDVKAAPTEEVGAETTSCACETFKLLCLTPEVFRATCRGGADACALNKPTCELYLKAETCGLLSMNPIGSVNPATLDEALDCGAHLTGSGNAEHQLNKAISCCTARHELVHVSDPRCFSELDENCIEAPARLEDSQCFTNVANTFSEQYPNEELILARACREATLRASMSSMSNCNCSESEMEKSLNQADEQSVPSFLAEPPVELDGHPNCVDSCFVPDDIPIACQRSLPDPDSGPLVPVAALDPSPEPTIAALPSQTYEPINDMKLYCGIPFDDEVEAEPPYRSDDGEVAPPRPAE